jgi:hypothetical protein
MTTQEIQEVIARYGRQEKVLPNFGKALLKVVPTAELRSHDEALAIKE